MGQAKQDTKPFHRIRWLAVVGGFLDGVRFEFGPGLNCIIGARGTGKTTALEFIRYALDAMPDERDACMRTVSRMFRISRVGIVWVDVWENVRGVPWCFMLSREIGNS